MNKVMINKIIGSIIIMSLFLILLTSLTINSPSSPFSNLNTNDMLHLAAKTQACLDNGYLSEKKVRQNIFPRTQEWVRKQEFSVKLQENYEQKINNMIESQFIYMGFGCDTAYNTLLKLPMPAEKEKVKTIKTTKNVEYATIFGPFTTQKFVDELSATLNESSYSSYTYKHEDFFYVLVRPITSDKKFLESRIENFEDLIGVHPEVYRLTDK